MVSGSNLFSAVMLIFFDNKLTSIRQPANRYHNAGGWPCEGLRFHPRKCSYCKLRHDTEIQVKYACDSNATAWDACDSNATEDIMSSLHLQGIPCPRELHVWSKQTSKSAFKFTDKKRAHANAGTSLEKRRVQMKLWWWESCQRQNSAVGSVWMTL